tara:strand:- start:318 stop:554 length:237 start_codon:yes stop_codon:yes gene_type:complete
MNDSEWKDEVDKAHAKEDIEKELDMLQRVRTRMQRDLEKMKESERHLRFLIRRSLKKEKETVLEPDDYRVIPTSKKQQ